MTEAIQLYKHWTTHTMTIERNPIQHKLSPQPMLDVFKSLKGLRTIVRDGADLPCGLLWCAEDPCVHTHCHYIEPQLLMTSEIVVIRDDKSYT